MSQKDCERRVVLKLIPLAIGTCALKAGCGGGASATGTVDVVGGMATLPFADYPHLKNTGGSAVINTANGASLIVVRTGATTAKAVSAICSHQGCDVNYNKPTNDFECPCHGSRFALSGKVTHGPAQAALESYPATVRTDSLVIAVG